MREIEVKAKLLNPKLFLENANSLGIKFEDEVIQGDTTYEDDTPYDSPSWNIFRIRKQDSKSILTMKHKASTRSRDNFEYETVINNEKEMIKILNRLGYNKGVNIYKVRRVARYKEFEICLDEVKHLGSFVEVEKLAEDDADVDEIQSELWNLLINLGVNEIDRVHKGYDTLMRTYLKEKYTK